MEGSWGETAHWEPFVQASIEYMITEGSPEKEVAFWFGSAMHGFEDESWDSLYDEKVTNV